MLRADWVEHLENTTYQLTLRGCGLDEPIAIVFRWPAELAIETDHVEPRRVLGGAQVRTEIGPKPESEINIESELEPSVESTVTETSSAATPQPESVNPVSLAPSVAPITHNVTAPAHGNVGTSPRRRSAWGLLLLSGLATTSGLAWVAGANTDGGTRTVIGHRTALAHCGARSLGHRVTSIPDHPRAGAFGHHRRCRRGEYNRARIAVGSIAAADAQRVRR
ncbi:MAG: hypothetical protein IPK83_24600 [Planctomycetes bacterium]|nr:hypothetical protein [Planctomycetota bacterium]